MTFANKYSHLLVIRKRKAPRIVECAVCLIPAVAALAAMLNMAPLTARAQSIRPAAPGFKGPGSLKRVPIQQPQGIGQYIKNQNVAVALGKALFWDSAVGSDGQACASCHFNAGADSRTKNQLNPGFRAIPPDNGFSTLPSGAGGPNYQLKVDDFPFHNVITGFDTNDIASSQGVTRADFVRIVPGNATDERNVDNFSPDPIFNDGAHNSVRGVEPRNTPTVINAIFNFRNFWDGRARDEFNCVNPIGDLDPTTFVLMAQNSGDLVKTGTNGVPPCRIENASLASQAVGPPLSDLEMSFGGRTFPKLGKKMLSFANALPSQKVSFDDSVFGSNINGVGVLTRSTSTSIVPGLTKSYKDLIQAAFQPKWWQSNQTVTVNPDGSVTFSVPTGAPVTVNQFTQMEFNFSLFWGLAIQMYETTLVADDSPFDRVFDNPSKNPLPTNVPIGGGLVGNPVFGLQVFSDKGRCFACDGGPETTNASVQNSKKEQLERMIMGNDMPAVYDNGFYNTAVRPCAGNLIPCDDQGLGATIGPLNLPLSMSRFFQLNCQFGSGTFTDPTTGQAFNVSGCVNAPLIPSRPAENLAFNLLQPNERVAVDGAFKTPGLRNVEITAPYFHNGGDATLMDVVEFYDRGGNFPEVNQDNLDVNIVPLNLSDEEKRALVALMITMTDERVKFQRAPFDHPELVVPNLVPGQACPLPPSSDPNPCLLPAVGKNGSAALPTFVQNLVH